MLASVTMDINDEHSNAIRPEPVETAILTRNTEKGFHGNDSGDTACTVISELTMITTVHSGTMLR